MNHFAVPLKLTQYCISTIFWLKTEEEMIHVRNLGKKSLNEVKEKLHSLGLSFKPGNE